MVDKVEAFRDAQGKLHATQEQAEAADFEAVFQHLWHDAFDGPGRSSYGVHEAKYFVWKNREKVHDILAMVEVHKPEGYVEPD